MCKSNFPAQDKIKARSWQNFENPNENKLFSARLSLHWSHNFYISNFFTLHLSAF